MSFDTTFWHHALHFMWVQWSGTPSTQSQNKNNNAVTLAKSLSKSYDFLVLDFHYNLALSSLLEHKRKCKTNWSVFPFLVLNELSTINFWLPTFFVQSKVALFLAYVSVVKKSLRRDIYIADVSIFDSFKLLTQFQVKPISFHKIFFFMKLNFRIELTILSWK